MFDVGFSEILIIAVVALIVLGPERLPKAARLAGLWVRKARAQWYAVKAELERELLDEELQRSLKGSLGELQQQLHNEQTELRREMSTIEDAAKSGPASAPPEPTDHEPPTP